MSRVYEVRLHCNYKDGDELITDARTILVEADNRDNAVMAAETYAENTAKMCYTLVSIEWRSVAGVQFPLETDYEEVK